MMTTCYKVLPALALHLLLLMDEVTSFAPIPPPTMIGFRSQRTPSLNNNKITIRYSTLDDQKLDPEKDLRNILKPTIINKGGRTSSSSSSFPEDRLVDLSTTPYLEEHDPDADSLGDVPIPTTGISVADEMEKANRDRFYSDLVRITGLGDGVLAAQILSSTSEGAYEPVRYLIRLSRKEGELDIDDDEEEEEEEEETTMTRVDETNDIERDDFVMVDIPPYSLKLEQEMRRMMGSNGCLKAILVTCRDNIHYDDTPGIFTIRRADLIKWEKAFPDVAIVAYRMDIPRDCRESVTQRLDGYGPWAMQEGNQTFVETGIPLTYNEWDPDLAMEILEGKRRPPGEEEEENELDSESDNVIDLDNNGAYTPDTIRSNEEGKRVLAVYTPGRTHGSVSYIFPELGLCASGYTLPLEDTRRESWGVDSTAGPALDARGFITTNKAGISKQMESARKLANDYSDRFQIVLPCRSDPFYLEEDVGERRQTLLEIADQYEKLGNIYEQLGITGSGEYD